MIRKKITKRAITRFTVNLLFGFKFSLMKKKAARYTFFQPFKKKFYNFFLSKLPKKYRAENNTTVKRLYARFHPHVNIEIFI